MCEGLKGQYTLGDKLQQQVAATDHSVSVQVQQLVAATCRATVTATNRFVCTGEVL